MHFVSGNLECMITIFAVYVFVFAGMDLLLSMPDIKIAGLEKSLKVVNQPN